MKVNRLYRKRRLLAIVDPGIDVHFDITLK